ncbi:MAG: sugar phosphate isomerase/epimerase [Anaerolineae bacterium]|nr:sugar phosphate isomerase/epimerase [Anaerolineae bacterium]
MPRLALCEDLLPGQSLLERFQQAADLGAAGIELVADDLDARMEQIVEAMAATGLEIATVDHGRRDGILDNDPDVRERALAELRQSVCDAADFGASGVVFTPQFGPLRLPDLTPFLSADGVAAELLLSHLRTLEDYAAAMGVKLFIRSRRREECAFLHRLTEAAAVARKRNHPAIRIAASTYDLLDEGGDVPVAIGDTGDMLGHLYVADRFDLAGISTALEATGYDGWITLERRTPNADHDLPAWVASLRASGLI